MLNFAYTLKAHCKYCTPKNITGKRAKSYKFQLKVLSMEEEVIIWFKNKLNFFKWVLNYLFLLKKILIYLQHKHKYQWNMHTKFQSSTYYRK